MYCNRYYFIRRRNLYKFVLLAIFTYMTYITLSAFGGGSTPSNEQNEKLVKRSDEGEIPLNDYLIKNDKKRVFIDIAKHNDNNDANQIADPAVVLKFQANEDDEHLKKVRSIIEKYDNTKNYHLIKDNGANAKGMKIDDKKLPQIEKEKYDEGWSKYAFNNYISTLMPLNRTVPDIRLPG